MWYNLGPFYSLKCVESIDTKNFKIGLDFERLEHFTSKNAFLNALKMLQLFKIKFTLKNVDNIRFYIPKKNGPKLIVF